MKMNTDELRELDAWIAEHVMCWKPSDMMGLREGRFAVRRNDGVYIPAHADAISHVKQFRPTESAADAVEVLESTIGAAGAMIWQAGDWHLRSCAPSPYAYAHAPTLPLAICLFAKAMAEQADPVATL